MGDDGQLAAHDTRDLLALLAEVVAAGGDLRARKSALAERVGRLIDADRWVWVVSTRPGSGERGANRSLLHRGHTDKEARTVVASIPSRLIESASRAGQVTRRRHDFVPDPVWRGSAHYRRGREPLGLDEYLCSVRSLPGGLVSVVWFDRIAGRAAFSDRHRGLVHAVFGAADGPHLMDVASGAPDVAGLPPRVRMAFDLLTQGLSRKQIADRLGISSNTVAEYASRIYRHCGVGGQRELMQRMGSGAGVPADTTLSGGHG